MSENTFHQALRELHVDDGETYDEVLGEVRALGRPEGEYVTRRTQDRLFASDEWANYASHILTLAAAFGDLPLIASVGSVGGKIQATIVFTPMGADIEVEGHKIGFGPDGSLAVTCLGHDNCEGAPE